MINQDDLLEQFTAEMLALEESGAGMPFVFTPHEAFMLLACLQLVLRHPGITRQQRPTATFARGLAENIQERISPHGEAIAEVARRGWNKEHDA